ncbi:TetR/AcrR family transcriptional regulator [Maricurvus nonylphenolicus]|uniref:TetR/AcrR family transcriptional regulator n=1 Tax=Maricurvus nonylphenolicus TaxID=1008307 RepID=UPI0036F2F4A2
MNTTSRTTKAAHKTDGRTINANTLEKLRTTILGLFAEALYQDVGIRTICERAKVSTQTVYKYFGNKEEILYACIKQDLDGLNASLIEAASHHCNRIDQVRVVLETWCNFYFDNPSIARIVFLNIPQAYWVGERQFVQSALHDALNQQVEAGQQAGDLWDQIPAELLNEMAIGAGHRLMIRWLTSDEISAEEVRTSYIAGVLQLITPR